MQLEKNKMSMWELDNSSGQGKEGLVPGEISGWNWGAFLLSWIWAIGNNKFDMAVYGLASYTLSFLIGPLGWLAELAISVILGMKGNEWAWQNKKWRSIEHFKKTQKTWLKWGIVASILDVLLLLWVGITEIGIWHI